MNESQATKMNGSIITYTGKRFFPLDPNPDDVDPIDIAHATSMQCRYTGHTKWFYPVSTHSILMHDEMVRRGESEDVCLWTLAHDWDETYLLDLAAPLKYHSDGFGTRFKQAAAKIEEAIAERFNMKLPVPPQVKELDLQIRAVEMDTLFLAVEKEDWGEILPISIPDWSPIEAKYEMLWRMKSYGLVERDRNGNFQTAREYALA